MISQTDPTSTNPTRTQTYDSAGRVSGYSIPAGSYSGLTYDALGSLTGYTGYTGYNGVAVNNTYSVREELLGQTFIPSGMGAVTATAPLTTSQGVFVQSPTQAWDGRTGATLGFVGTSGSFTYDAKGRITAEPGSTTLSYDDEGRVVGGASETATITNCSSGTTTTLDTLSSAARNTWGADGILSQAFFNGEGIPSSNSWHWAGGQLLYANTAGGINIKRGSLGILIAGSSPTFFDRELNGTIASSHNSTGTDAWNVPNPYMEPCAPSFGVPASANYQPPSSTFPLEPTPDTINDFNNIFAGANALSTTSLSFLAPNSGNTPYAYSQAGRRHTKDNGAIDPNQDPCADGSCPIIYWGFAGSGGPVGGGGGGGGGFVPPDLLKGPVDFLACVFGRQCGAPQPDPDDQAPANEAAAEQFLGPPTQVCLNASSIGLSLGRNVVSAGVTLTNQGNVLATFGAGASAGFPASISLTTGAPPEQGAQVSVLSSLGVGQDYNTALVYADDGRGELQGFGDVSTNIDLGYQLGVTGNFAVTVANNSAVTTLFCGH